MALSGLSIDIIVWLCLRPWILRSAEGPSLSKGAIYLTFCPWRLRRTQFPGRAKDNIIRINDTLSTSWHGWAANVSHRYYCPLTAALPSWAKLSLSRHRRHYQQRRLQEEPAKVLEDCCGDPRECIILHNSWSILGKRDQYPRIFRSCFLFRPTM